MKNNKSSDNKAKGETEVLIETEKKALDPGEQAQEASKDRIIIEGITQEGQKFRPSDWAERMSGSLAEFRGHRIYYSPQLQPITTKGGNKCVALDPALKESNPKLYQAILDFASSNKLRICNEDESD